MAETIEVIRDPKIYKDPSLPMVVHAIDFIKLWDTAPKASDFLSAKTNKRNLLKLDWLEQFKETERAQELTLFMSEELNIPIGDRLLHLPSAWITGNAANIFYDQPITFGLAMPTRIRDELCGALYSFPNYWLSYYHLEYLKHKYSAKADMRYRISKITDLQKCVGLALSNILKINPKLTQTKEVIVNATDSVSEMSVLYCDAERLYRWIQSGHTLKELCTNWIINKTNPTVG